MANEFTKVPDLEEAVMGVTDMVRILVTTRDGKEQVINAIKSFNYPRNIKIPSKRGSRSIPFAGWESGIISLEVGSNIVYENPEIAIPYQPFDPHDTKSVNRLNNLWKRWFHQEIPLGNYHLDNTIAEANKINKSSLYF